MSEGNTELSELGELAKLDMAIAELEVDVKNRKRSRLAWVLGGTAALTILALALTEHSMTTAEDFGVALLGYAVGFGPLLWWLVSDVQQIASRERELELTRARRKIRWRFEVGSEAEVPPPSVSYFDRLVEINVENLAEYYTLIKLHTNYSYRASLSAGLVGFILIAVALIIGYASQAYDKTMVYVSAGSGVVTEFIAAIFFYLYNRTILQMKEYHDSLLEVQNVLLSFKILDELQDAEQKPEILSQMITYLIGGENHEPASVSLQGTSQ